MNPLISIIIPAYNVEPYLRKCLDSLIRQQSTVWEAIIIEDGSDDATGSICDEYAERDSRFRVFHKDNGGVSAARNLGLDKANGDWIWFVDADDWVAPQAITTLEKSITSYTCDLIIFGIEYYNEDLTLAGNEKRRIVTDRPKDETIELADYPPQNYLVKRSIIEKHHIRFSEGVPMGEDLEFQYKCLMMCKHPVSIDSILYMYLRRQGSAVRNEKSRLNAADSSIIVLENLIQFIIQNRIVETRWISARMNRIFKNVLSSNAIIGRYEKGIQRHFRESFQLLKNYGHKDFIDTPVWVGRLSIRLYSLLINVRKLVKR